MFIYLPHGLFYWSGAVSVKKNELPHKFSDFYLAVTLFIYRKTHLFYKKALRWSREKTTRFTVHWISFWQLKSTISAEPIYCQMNKKYIPRIASLICLFTSACFFRTPLMQLNCFWIKLLFTSFCCE